LNERLALLNRGRHGWWAKARRFLRSCAAFFNK
jgi:hypothetical protein